MGRRPRAEGAREPHLRSGGQPAFGAFVPCPRLQTVFKSLRIHCIKSQTITIFSPNTNNRSRTHKSSRRAFISPSGPLTWPGSPVLELLAVAEPSSPPHGHVPGWGAQAPTPRTPPLPSQAGRPDLQTSSVKRSWWRKARRNTQAPTTSLPQEPTAPRAPQDWGGCL